MKTLKKIIAFSIIAGLILMTIATAQTAFAAEGLADHQFSVGKILNLADGQQQQSYFKTNGNTPIVNLVLTGIDVALRVIGSLAVIILIIGGFRMMVSQGDQTALDSAKEIVKYAVFGLVITFLSYIIVIFVQSLFVTETVI